MRPFTPIHTYAIEKEESCETTQPYYHLLYFEKGNGVHTLNGIPQSCKVGSFVTIRPTDTSCLKAHASSRIIQLSLTTSHAAYYSQLLDLLTQKRTFYLDDIPLMIWVNLVESMRLYHLDNSEPTSPLYNTLTQAMMQLLDHEIDKLVTSAIYAIPPLDEVLRYVERHIEEPAQLQVAQLARYFRCSGAAFSEWFRRNKGVGYKEYVDKFRVKRLKRWLNNPDITVKEIAQKLGFTDEFHLSHFFKKQTSFTPSSYREQRKGGS